MIYEKFWITICLLGLGTVIIRSSFIFFSDRLVINDEVRKLFSYIPAAVLPALAVPMVFFHQGHVDLIYGKERMVALFFSLAVSLYSKNIALFIFSGLISLYLITII